MYNLSGKLDIVGLPGFSHNFGALDGKHAGVMEVFDTFGAPSAPRQSMQASSSWRRNIKCVAPQDAERVGDGCDRKEAIIGLLINGANDSEFRQKKL
ncbi:hypothetical protein V8E55_002524 [Tylopilus felleus]